MSRDVVINGRFLSRRVTGVERYGREILSFLGPRSRVETMRFHGARGHLWEQLVLPTKLTSQSILWSPANTGPLWIANQALTIHDLSPLEHPGWFRKSFALWYRLFLPILAKRVRLVFTPSHYVKQKVIRRFGIGNVVVAQNGVNTIHFHPGAEVCMEDLPNQFVLFVGSLQPRKNLQTLLHAWSSVKDEYTDLWLIVAGDGGSIFRNPEFDTHERVRFLGYVTDDALPGLYAKASLFVLPSLDEGFGLPALEAMACGTPVIVSDAGALPEIVDDAALIFRRMDPAELAAAMRECLANRHLKSSLIDKGFARIAKFSWHTSAELIWNSLHEI